MNLRHVLEEPLDVRPLAAQLALLPDFAGLDSSGVVEFNSFGIARREVVVVSTVVGVGQVVMVVSAVVVG